MTGEKLMPTLRWLTPLEAAEYLGCSASFLHRNRRQMPGQRIPFMRFGVSVRYDIDDLTAYLEARKEGEKA